MTAVFSIADLISPQLECISGMVSYRREGFLIRGEGESDIEDEAPLRCKDFIICEEGEDFLNCDDGEFAEEDSQGKNLAVCSAADSKSVAQFENERRFTVPRLDADIWSDVNGESTEENSALFRWEDFLNCDEGESFEEDSKGKNLTVYSAADSKSIAQLENKRRLTVTRLDADFWSDLHDDLVEKVMARLPPTSLFKVLTLSKTWNLRFRSDSFQNEVISAATSWTAYAPVLFTVNNDVLGYERRSKQWYRLPTSSCPPQFLNLKWNLRAVDGSLFCWTTDVHALEVFVTNPLTGSWTQLPRRLDMGREHLFVHLVLREGGTAYKVIIGNLTYEGQIYRHRVGLEIFDSIDGAWTVESYLLPTSRFEKEEVSATEAALVNGVLHVVVSEFSWHIGLKCSLISFDVEQKVWKNQRCIFPVSEVGLFQSSEPGFFLVDAFEPQLRLVAAGQKVMLVLHSRTVQQKVMLVLHSRTVQHRSFLHDCKNYRLSVFRFDLVRSDLDSVLAVEVSRAPAEMVDTYFKDAVYDGDCIYIGTSSRNCTSRPYTGKSIRYNVGTQKWHWFVSAPGILPRFNQTFSDDWLWTSLKYQPGWSPFLKV